MVETKRVIVLLFYCITFFLMGASRAQSLREEQGLFDRPDGTQSIAKIKAGTAVKPIKRQGFWTEVQVGTVSGWLKVSMLNFGGASVGVNVIDTGRLGSGNIVSTSAVRGLSAKDLINGTPNFAELQKLEQLNADASSVIAFMAGGNVIPIEQKIALNPVTTASLANPGGTLGNASSSATSTKPRRDDDW